MTEIKKVIVNGVEYEVSVEVSDDGKWQATVEGTTFEVEIPDSGPVVKKKKKKAKEGTRCWKGYEKKGTKKMFGKTVPNCVKKEGKSPHKKGTKKYKKHMAAMHAG